MVMVTEEWVGGAAPSAGSGDNGLDIYTYTIIKTGSAGWTVISTSPTQPIKED